MPLKCQICTAEIPSGTDSCPECAPTLGESDPQAPSATTSPGRRFSSGVVLAGRYRVAQILGIGGMGEVYQADDLKLGVPVALKLLPAHLGDNEKRLSLLLNEVRLARQITHPNVCRIHDVGELEGLHFISMELLSGENLASLLGNGGRLPIERAIDIARGLCAGLDAAHGQGILHLDLKPSNLMIDDRGEVNITDFGLSLHLGGGGSARPPKGGTPAYMAPEQYLDGEVSVATDLYAVGLVLYELFTGRRPFEARSPTKLAWLHCRVPPTAPTDLVPDLDPAIERVILRCLAKEPRDRPASAQAVAAAFPGRVALSEGTVLKTLLASALVAQTQLIASQGDAQSAALFERHDRLVRDLAREHGGREVEKSNGGFLVLFERPIHAVLFARAYHRALDDLELTARLGIHLGEVVLRRSTAQDVARGAKPVEVEGLAKPTVMRLMGLASGHQTLLTRAAFNVARRSAVDETVRAERLHWLAHGNYKFKGVEELVEIFEVGEPSISPLQPPNDSEDAQREVAENVVLGWRPAPGLEAPSRKNWTLDRKLGEGGFGEVWIAFHRQTHERRVFKFCYEFSRLRSLKREITLFRLLKEELGDREDIARILDWNLEKVPYFIESEYTVGGNLAEWAETRGGIGEIPLKERLEIVAQVAGALAAAHSVGVLHKDVKPTNILIWRESQGRARARLTDFGIGSVTERHRLKAAGITALGPLRTDDSLEAGGTRLYMAPELIEGKVATVQADVFSLGVVLYQVVVGDLSRALAEGWRRDIDNPLLREDIAAAVEGVPHRRLAHAGDLEKRLRNLGERSAEQRTEVGLKKALERAQARRRFATAAALVLAVFALTMTWLTLQIRRESDRAREQTHRSQELARAAIAGHFLSEGNRWGHLLTLEVREPEETPTAVALLHKALLSPIEEMVFEGHNHAVLTAAWSPRDPYVLTGSQDGTARIWDLHTGTEVASLFGHTAAVSSVSWSPDGGRALSASWDTTARLWDALSSKPLTLLEGHTDLVASALFGPYGERVITASWDGSARIFDAQSGEQVILLEGHQDRVTSARFNFDGSQVVTASRDGTARLWNARTGKLERLLATGDAAVNVATFSPDGRRILTASEDGIARLWNPQSAVPLQEISGHDGGISTASFSPDGERILTGSWDGTAQLWGTNSGKRLTTLSDNHDWAYASFSPDGTQVLTRSRDQIGLWHAETGRRLATLPRHGILFTATFSPDGSQVLTGSSDNTARVWNTQTGEQIHTLPGPAEVRSAVFSPSGKQVLTHSRDGTTQLWDPQNGQLLSTLIGRTLDTFPDPTHATRLLTWSPGPSMKIWNARNGDLVNQLGLFTGGEAISSATLDPAGKRILTTSKHTAHVWDVGTGRSLVTLTGHTGEISTACFSPDGQWILTASRDHDARLWSASTGQTLATLEGHSAEVLSARFSPDASYVLTHSWDRSAHIWDPHSGALVATLRGHSAPISHSSFAPQGERVLTTSHDGTGRVWNISDGHQVPLVGHDDQITSAAWSPEGDRIVTGSADHTARIWNSQTGEELARMDGHTDAVQSVSFHPQGTHILTGSNDRTARIWAATNQPVSYLQSRIRSRARLCLPVDARVDILLESPDQAKENTATCERCTALFFEKIEGASLWQWSAYLEAWDGYEHCLGRENNV